jgi:hypothetical protein
MNDDWTIEKDGEVRWQGILVHEYVPGEYTHPMRTEPDCRDCGESRLSPVHQTPTPTPTTFDCVVTLHTEQEAVITLTGLERDDLGETVLREMALEKLDESGGAEWTTTTAYEDYEWYDGGQAPKGLT